MSSSCYSGSNQIYFTYEEDGDLKMGYFDLTSKTWKFNVTNFSQESMFVVNTEVPFLALGSI